METALLKELERIVGKAHVRSGPADREVYSYDASPARQIPAAVVFPVDAVETARVVRAAFRAGVPVVPRGFGTNLSGGSVAPPDGLVICLSRMNRILSIEPARRCARLQPCVTNLELQNALAPLGFFYAPDPASQKVSTLGGNVAENSGGPRCVKYGVTKNHVLALEIVLADGERMRVGSEALDPPGYDLCGLLTGSEGTLAVVTEMTVRLLPIPESAVTFLAVFGSVSDAARCVSAVMAEGIVPSSLEMMDAPVMRAVEQSMPCGYPLDAAAVLIIEIDGPEKGLATLAGQIREICMANRCRQVQEAVTPDERSRLWAGRRGAFGAIARISPGYLVTDCTVPRTRLPEALDRVAEIAARHGLSFGNVFHAGDGNLHPLLFFDPAQPDQIRTVREAGMEIMKACVAMGGTITGEHGVGLEKKEAMGLLFSVEDLAFQRSVKDAFDPSNLLNPGKIFPELSSPLFPAEEATVRIEGLDRFVPFSAEECRRMVLAAARQGLALAPEGAARWRSFGNAPARPWVPISSEGLCEILDYDPPNQVVTVGPGVRLGRLQSVLAPQNQWLPLRPFLDRDGTLGGIVALNACGPERLLYGGPRDLLLGLRFVSAAGRLIRAGGKVVKNVAGYDLTRLLVGSMGTVGFFTELALRVAPLPQVCRMVSGSGSLDKIKGACAELLVSPIEPAFAVAIPDGDRTNSGARDRPKEQTLWRLHVGFEGFPETVEAQTGRWRSRVEAYDFTNVSVLPYEPAPGPFEAAEIRLDGCPFLIRIDLPLDKTCDCAASFDESHHPTDRLLADLGCGRLRAGFECLSASEWESLSQLAKRLGGHAMLERAPSSFRDIHDVFGAPSLEGSLVHKLKQALDPAGLFAPGRLPGRK